MDLKFADEAAVSPGAQEFVRKVGERNWGQDGRGRGRVGPPHGQGIKDCSEEALWGNVVTV